MKEKKTKILTILLLLALKNALDVSDVPPFDPKLHQSTANYIHINIEDDPSREKEDLVDEYVEKWMKLSENEQIKIKALSINGRNVENRFEGKYFNKKQRKAKTYYFTVNFGNGMEDSGDYQDKSAVSINPGAEYNTNYGYTLEKDCSAIKKKFKVDDVKCTPLVKDNYIINSVYNAELIKFAENENESGTVEEKIVIVRAINEQKAKNLNVDLNDISIYKKVMEKIEDSDEVPSSNLNRYLNKPIIKGQIKSIVNHVKAFNDLANTMSFDLKSKYQKKLRQTLFKRQNENLTEEKNLKKSFGLINQISEQISAFNIEQAIKRDMYDMKFQEKILSHEAKANYYFDELRISQAMDDLDSLEFEKDKEMEMNFNKLS